jgi:hypothetical protein
MLGAALVLAGLSLWLRRAILTRINAITDDD